MFERTRVFIQNVRTHSSVSALNHAGHIGFPLSRYKRLWSGACLDMNTTTTSIYVMPPPPARFVRRCRGPMQHPLFPEPKGADMDYEADTRFVVDDSVIIPDVPSPASLV